MAALQPVSVLDVLDSIPFAPERPLPQGTQAARRWTSLLLDILLHPTRWHKLGLAVQWAKWVEWEGGLDLKGPIRTPGVLHLQNPLHPFALNQLLNLLDFALLDIETLIGCADTGDWTCLFKEEIDSSSNATETAKIREQAARSLEYLCLLTFYLRQGLCSLTGNSVKTDPREQTEDAQIQDLIARILRNDKTTAVAAANGIWYQAFSEQALRLTPQQDPRNSVLPSKLSVILNEVLEAIRMNKLRRDGWTDPAQTDKLSDQQFQQLGKFLSTSFFTIMEFADVSLFLPAENVVMLSQFAPQLPASWYSDDFLRTTIRLAKRYIATEQQEKVRVPIQIQGLTAITTLWSFWMRKTGAADANVLGQELIEVMAQVLSIPSLFTGVESKGLFGACFSGLATGLDKWAGLMEPKIVEGLVSGLERGRLSALDSDMDGIQASLATVIRSDAMNQTPDSIKKLATAFLQSFYGSISSVMMPMVISSVDELFQIQRLFQFVVTQKAGLVAVMDEDDGKKKRKKRKPKKAVILKGQAWFEALVQGIQDVSTSNALPGLLAITGILRAIQHGEDDPPKVDEESLALIQDVFVARLNGLVDGIKADGKEWTLSSQTQACLVFSTCQTIPNLPVCKLEALDRSFLTSLLVDYMLQPNEGVVPVNEIIRTINYELARERNRLVLNGPSHTLLTKTVRDPLFSEMGRVARTVATFIESMDSSRSSWSQIEDTLQKLHSFAINLHVDWSRCALSQVDSFVEHAAEGDRIGGLDAETTKASGMLFQAFKTLLFAYTMIFGAILEKSKSDPVPVGLVSQLDCLILDSYAYLFFVTYKLGPGGFQVYEELVTSILTRMVVSEDQSATLVHQGHDDNKDGNPNRHVLLNKSLRAMMPRAELGFHDPVMESRTLFFMNLLERVMVAIDETPLESQLLPLVYPYLLKNDQRDLFESAHSVVMSVFLTNKRIAQQVAPFYSNLLLQHFPDQINIDQLRAAFTTMIRSLSGTEDALAWLCVEKLLERIQQYDDELAEVSSSVVQVEGERREGEKALVEVATSVQQDLSPQESATHLPSLGTLTPTPTVTAAAVATTSLATLERRKERGQLLLALFDQLSSLNLVFVETLGLKIRELIVKEPSAVGRRALLKCLLDVIGGPAVDHTKRDWAVKWYLGLANEFGQQGASSSKAARSSTPSAHAH
ncbi:hypothetical protein BGX23_001366 [Mortierella sp. AD031]|nr:hypothetical protein BGX23_001366 [Mortierella sp. AD031]KAG0213439.1 hypothetical protein BGX33_002883 [Mortierella sp. NVP41]